jgi:ectoine hydroxylase-related dioxygenase (phytanoyl-CoA dioxygenase family)
LSNNTDSPVPANLANTQFAYTKKDRLVQDFASRGLVVLAPEDLGIPDEVHQRVYTQEKRAHDAQQPVTPSSIPDVLEVLNAPGLVDACNRLVGKNWAIVPFTHNASFTSGARDQHWHKDDNAPYNSRKQRHHQAVQIEMLYYPQDVREDMGPTATVPYSQYWASNHEENHDNFAGADHLDFAYQLGGMEGKPISGPDSEYSVEDIVNRNTAHDARMRDAVHNLDWPLVMPLEAAPLRAGSVVIYSHNTFHRGNHRRDDWRNWPENPRFMWRFWLYRTTDAVADTTPLEPDWQGVDPLTQKDLSAAGDDVKTVWRYHNHWIQTSQAPPPQAVSADLEALAAQLLLKGEENEPARIGAAYRLAADSDTDSAIDHLTQALYDERESVRRAATYGLIAVGPDATDAFIEASHSVIKWVRKAGVYGLGDASPLNKEVLAAVTARLNDDPSVYIRSVAAGTLGCLGRRAVATGCGTEYIPACFEALLACLDREENRLAMDRAQGRSIKFVRPTDECDVCEGNGIDFGLERFKPVRSAVRENALWSIVILSSHGAALAGTALEPTVTALKTIIRNEENVICVGFAMDALNRLANLNAQAEIPLVSDLRDGLITSLKESPVRSWEALVRGGLDAAALAEFKQPA